MSRRRRSLTDRAELERQRGARIWERASASGWPDSDVFEAIGAMTEALRLLPPADPMRAEILLPLALAFAWRYAALAGPATDRDEAIALASEYLAAPDGDKPGAAACRCAIAWMAISRQFTPEQRNFARAWSFGTSLPGVQRLRGHVIAVADAETALGQLAEIEDPAVLDDQMAGFVATTAASSALALIGSGQPPHDLGWIIAEIDRAAGLMRHDESAVAELLVMRAVLLGPALLRRLTEADGGPDFAAEVERVLQALEQLPADTPGREQMVVRLCGELLHLTTAHRSAVPIERVIALLETITERLAPDDPVRVIAEGMSAGAIGLRGATDHRPDVLDEAAERLARTTESAPPGHVARPFTVLGEASVLAERYVLSGELRHLQPAEQKIGEFFDALASSTVQWPDVSRGIGHHVRGTLRIARFRHFPEDRRVLADAVADLELAVELIPDDHPLYARSTAHLGAARAFHETSTAQAATGFSPTVSATARDGFGQAFKAANMAGFQHPDYPALIAQGAAGLILQALSDRDIGAIDRAISALADASSTVALTTRERPPLLHAHGSALLLRYQMTRDTRDLGNAIDRLEEARRAVEQEDASPHASAVLQSLCDAYRARADSRRGDVDRAVEVGLAALREHAGDVLLQDNDDNALGAGRHGAEDAFAMARWFLSHGRPASAVDAIEFGRGMVLHAATIGAALPGVLRSAGHETLAQEWERERARHPASGPERSDDLRYRTMLAIEGSQAEARLLATPSVEEIRAALAATATDALAYLMPEDDDGPGMAVIVDRAGTVTGVPLPGLRTGPSHPIGSCERARREADQIEVSSPRYDAARQCWRDALGELCDWAWRAAIEPLLAVVPVASRGPRRLVLVPIGQLGLVPWHASRRKAGTPRRYACEAVVFSYAAAARQFVDAAALLRRPWGERPVLVTDSRSSSYATASGVEYIRTNYYPASAVFGSARRFVSPAVPGSATITPHEVLAALPGAESGAASMLHFGCHGKTAVPVLDSGLDLGAGGRLAVREILGQARRSARPDSGGLVVLAACMSDLTEADYDEALTLTAAFLVAGAAGVVGARWSITEDQTALFMVLFHRALSRGAADAARALRSAQLWMLDPDREPPDGLPKILSDEVGQPDLADPSAWAAFAYQGQ